MAIAGVYSGQSGQSGKYSAKGVHSGKNDYDVAGDHAGGPGSAALSAAIGIAGEGVMQRWDGTATYNPLMPTDVATRLRWLQPSARGPLLAHDAAQLFAADLSLPGQASLLLRGKRYLTLHFPTVPDLAAQMPHMRTAVDLRADRLPEIMAQQGDMLSFFGAVLYLHPDRSWWTGLLLSALHEAVIGIEMGIKFHANLPRPIDFSPNVFPIIQTPAHSTYPSGHATEAFAFATVLSALRLAGAGAADPASAILDGLKPSTRPLDEKQPDRFGPADYQLFKLAHRIADNRTVAGVHFPVDSAHGALLGLALGLGLVGSLNRKRGRRARVPGGWDTASTETVPSWTCGFTLNGWRDDLGDLTTKTVALKGLRGLHVLPTVWARAKAEWTTEGTALPA